MNMLVFDQSTTITGFSIWKDGGLQEYGVIDLHRNSDTEERFMLMVAEISRVVNNNHPSLLVVEDVAQQSNVAVLKVLARLQGAILRISQEYNVNVVFIKPTEWRSKLGFQQGAKIKRDALKQQALIYIKDQYGYDVIEDVAEAICIGDAYLKMINKEK